MGWHGNLNWHLESDKSAFWAHRPGFFISPLSLTEREKQSSALFVYFKPFRSLWKQQKNIPYRCVGCSVLNTYDTWGSSEKSGTLNTFNWYVKHLYLYRLNVKPVNSLRTIYMCINLENIVKGHRIRRCVEACLQHVDTHNCKAWSKVYAKVLSTTI